MRRALFLAGLAVVAAPATAAPTLDAAYGDHMVVQRGDAVTISGTAKPGDVVKGSFGSASANARADASGHFRISFAAQPANADGATLTLSDSTGSRSWNDILVGDVWLCSGQSNMELTVNRALNTWNELRLAPDHGVRLLKIPQATAAVPQDRFSEPVAWVAADSNTVADFSAACYYMAKQLRDDRDDVPVGLIHSNWGGSAARAWLTPEGVRNMFGQKSLDQLQQYERDPMAAAQGFVPQWYDWWRANDQDREPWKNPASLDWTPVPQISFWNDWKGSGLDENAVANVWLRKDFELTAEQAKSGGTLSVGALDDLDLTWVNGHPVGYTFGWGTERHYRVPAEYLKPGKNSILISVNNMWDTGGFFSSADRLNFEPKKGVAVPLGEGWDYSIGAVKGTPPRAPWDANAGMGVMHNYMIAPLGPMRLAGVAWYQGEADVGQPDYDAKLRELFAGWRGQFGDQARMLVVQLADYGARTAKPVESGWAQLREEQLEGVAADSNAALVTAIDIGEPTDIHPANKNLLGRRLAAAAEGDPMPMPVSAVLAGDMVKVTFSGIEDSLQALGGPVGLGFELCGDSEGSCRYVVPRIEGNSVLLPTDGKVATRVRYAWADAPIVNVYDAREMPLPGFELSVSQ